jgi:hypothetical protein
MRNPPQGVTPHGSPEAELFEARAENAKLRARIKELEEAPLNLPGAVEAKRAVAERDALKPQVEEAMKILSGGYQQGDNGLVISRNKAEAWLKGSLATKPKHGSPKIICECGDPIEVHPGLGPCHAVDKLGFASCRCQKFA